MKHFHKKILNITSSEFFRNVAVVGGGIAAAQAINFTLTPFITRLYGPEAFGTSAAITAIINIITPIATFGYSNAITLPKNETVARSIAQLSIICGTIISLIIFILISIYLPKIAELANLKKDSQLLYLIPFSIFFTGLLSITNQYLIRIGSFKEKSIIYVETKFFTGLLKLIGGISLPSGIFLSAVILAEPIINIALQLTQLSKLKIFSFLKGITQKNISSAASEYRDFPLFRMPQGVIRSGAMSLPILALTNLYGASESGQYTLCALILGAPVMVLADSVREVFYPKITKSITNKTGNTKSIIIKISMHLFIIGIIPFGIIFIFGKTIIPLIFGNQWTRAGEYSQWMSLWMLSTLACEPAISAMPALKIQSTLLTYELTITIIRAVAIYAGSIISDDIMSISLFSIVNTIGCGILLSIIINKSSKNA